MIVIDPVIILLDLPVAIRQLTVQLTRDGEQTISPKVAMLLDPIGLVPLAAFTARDGFQSTQQFLASAIDGARLILATDEVAPRRAAARYPYVSEDVTFVIDLNDGSGDGATGTPATLAARVRVDNVVAEREVLAVERQTDGSWRIAGSLHTADGAIDLRVVGGEVYALAFDDYGALYQPNLTVTAGQTIRPSQYSGWLYRITEPGTLPAIEPQWWAAEGDNAPRLLGTARAIAVRYYQPLAHGPVPVELL